MGEPIVVTAIPPPPDRPADAHKGVFGTVGVLGGSRGMIGAPAYVARAAFRAGAGLVKIITQPKALAHCLTIEPSATGFGVRYLSDPERTRLVIDGLGESTVLAVGPGMGVHAEAGALISYLFESGRPMVIDADGLNNLADMGNAIPPAHGPMVLTPHPGEYRRLAQAADIEIDPTDPDQRRDAAAVLALRYGAVCVLKGHRTVVHDGDRCFINTTGNPALSTAGTGDVLTGVIASLMAQGMGAFDASVLGVALHGRAADLWAQRHGQAGMLARDLADLIPAAIQERRNKR